MTASRAISSRRALSALLTLALVAATLVLPPPARSQEETESLDYVANRALVGVGSAGRSRAAQAIRDEDGRVLSYYEPGRFFVVETPGNAPDWVKRVRGERSVRFAEPDYIVTTADIVPNDTRWTELWGLQKIKAHKAWHTNLGSKNVVVGVIDTGVAYTHEDIGTGQMWTNTGEIAGNGLDDDGNGFKDDIHGADCRNDDGNPTDDNDHGTHVAGTIGAATNNSKGVAGVNWNVSIMALKFLGSNGSGSISDAIECLDYAIAEGATLTNNSWGGGGFSEAMYDAIERARDADQLFFAAAGNDEKDTDSSPHYPSAYDLANIVAVAATTSSDGLASFSNYGESTVDIGAPGVDILSTVRNNAYESWDGTSMATPHVAGAAALLWAEYPASSYTDIRNRIYGSVDPVSALSGMVATGGRLNVARAFDSIPPGAPTGLTVSDPGTGDALDLDWSNNSEGDLAGYNVYRATDPTGTWTKRNSSLLSSSAYTDTGVTNGTTYHYRVTAVDFSDNESTPSTVASKTPVDVTAPAAPEGLAATPGDSQVALDWSNNSEGDLDGYNVYRATDPTGTWTKRNSSLLSSSAYTDTGVTNGTTYHYRVTAVDFSDNESPPSNEVTATPDVTPNQGPSVTLDPSNPTEVDEGPTHVTYGYSISDPQGDAVASVTTSCGTGGSKVAGSDENDDVSGSFRCTFPDGPASPTVSAQATDSLGATGNSATQSVTVDNVAPSLGLDGPTTVVEGDDAEYDFAVSDPGDDGFSVNAGYPSCGDFGVLAEAVSVDPSGGSFTCSFDSGSGGEESAVAMKVSDSDGASAPETGLTVGVEDAGSGGGGGGGGGGGDEEPLPSPSPSPEDDSTPEAVVEGDASASFFSPNGDGRKDAFELSATFSEEVAWSFEIYTVDGATGGALAALTAGAADRQVVFSAAGSGASMSVSWDGTTGGVPAAEGPYEWSLSATDAVGHQMAPLSGAVTIDRTAPTLERARVRPRRLTPKDRAAKIVAAATERSTVRVKITRRSRLVKRFPVVVIAADEVARFAWRARTSSGRRVAPGRYRVVIRALDRAGNLTRRSATIRVVRG